MSRSWLISTVAGPAKLGLLVVVLGCSSTESTPMAAPPQGAGGATVEAPNLRFLVDDPNQTLALFPEEIRKFDIVASPPGVHRVRFSIVPVEQMPPHDASLDRTDVDTTEEGFASVTLRAPSIVTVFDLQASIGGKSSASLSIGVQAKGRAELQVVPKYEGERQISQWIANAYMNIHCSELAQKVTLDRGLPSDSTSFNAASVFGIPPRIKQVPVGPFMAVTVRSGHYVFGCTNIEQTLTNELNTVQVSVANRPIVLDQRDTEVLLSIDETTQEWMNHLQAAADEVLRAFTDESDNDLALLLDTMHGLLDDPDTRDSFDARRELDGWEVKALHSLDVSDGLLLRRKLTQWLESGTQALTLQDAFAGQLTTISEMDVQLELQSVAGIAAEQAGFITSVPATWSADPSDTVALGATLAWSPSQLVLSLAETRANAEYSVDSGLAGALSELVDCRALALSLQVEASDPVVFDACDVDCTLELCESALVSLSERAQEASDDEQRLRLSATGKGVVDDESQLVSFEGTWRGTFPMGESSAVGGTISGHVPQGAE